MKDIGRRTGIDYAAGTYIRQILGRLLIDCVGEAIRQVGQGKVADAGEVLSHLVEDRVAEDDREHFLKIAKEEIAALHEGNFARYRLRPGEFLAWPKRKT